MRKRSSFHRPAIVLAAIVIAALAHTGCSKPAPPAAPIDAGRAAIGIEVSIRKPIAIGSDPAQIVYFARLEEGDGIESIYSCDNVIASNFDEGHKLLLLNARPGTYAAVAATLSKLDPAPPPDVSANPPAPTPASPKMLDYRTYFPKDLIARTCFTIIPNTFTHMGKIKVAASVGMGNADEAQKHYQQIIEGPVANRSETSRLLDSEFSSCGSLLELHDDAATEQAFVSKVMPRLQNTGWGPVLAQPHRERAQ